MAYTPLTISIPAPCHEDWEGMHAVAGTTARHCDSCAKNVVDFTGMTDAQMHAYVRENRGKLCGRFRADQIDRPLRAAHGPGKNPLRVAATAAGLMLGIGSLAAQQNPAPKPVSTQVVRLDSVAPPTPPPPMILGRIATPPPPPPETKIEVMGEIMPIRPELPTTTKDTLPDEWIGDVEITERDSVPPALCEPAPPFVTMGIVAYTPPVPTGINKIKDTLRRAKDYLLSPTAFPTSTVLTNGPEINTPRNALDQLRVGPNPFDRRFDLTYVAPLGATLMVELLDPNGQLVHAQPWSVAPGENTLRIRPGGSLRFGIYYLRVTNAGGDSTVRTMIRSQAKP